MDSLADNRTFQIFFLSCLGVSVVISMSALYILKRRGVDVYLVRNMLKIGLLPAQIILLPIWLSPLLSIQAKILLTIATNAFAVANFFAVHYGGKRFRRTFGIVTEEDRREK